MTIEIINTGTELLLGNTLNTHQQWLCRELTRLGQRVGRVTVVADHGPAIEQAVREALGRADVVITTGGLGPTTDDLTCECIACLLGRPLREDLATRAAIEAFFRSRGRPVPSRTLRQALVPDGAVVLANPHGTAPGLAIELRPNPLRPGAGPAWLFMLPGPSRELRPMFRDQVLPRLQQLAAGEPPYFTCTLRTTGVGESVVQERIGPALGPLVTGGLEVGYCSRPGRVDIRLAARGESGRQLVEHAMCRVEAILAAHVFGREDEELEEVVIRLLTRQHATLALAESCTGGAIAHRLTNVPGASAVFLAGLVTYSNRAKEQFLGVQAATLAAHGAVSEAVAREMAEGARRHTQATYALAVTGIAGPDGGTPEKPVGTVFLALAGPFPTLVQKQFNPYDRLTFKEVTANQALELLRAKLVAARTAGEP